MTHAEELKSSGLKATLPRIKILEVFQRTERRHLTAEDVFKMLLAEGADIGLATVYRVLMQFEQAGLLLLDLVGAYAIHFIQHKIKWLWKFHMVHHADTHVDTTTANRH